MEEVASEQGLKESTILLNRNWGGLDLTLLYGISESH